MERLPPYILAIKVKANKLYAEAARCHTQLRDNPSLDKEKRLELCRTNVINMKQYKDLLYILEVWRQTGELLPEAEERQAKAAEKTLQEKIEALPEGLADLKLKKRSLITQRSQNKANPEKLVEIQTLIQKLNEKIATIQNRTHKPKRKRGRPRTRA